MGVLALLEKLHPRDLKPGALEARGETGSLDVAMMMMRLRMRMLMNDDKDED